MCPPWRSTIPLETASPESDSLTHLLGRGEGIEDVRQNLGRNADAVIPHLQFDLLAIRRPCAWKPRDCLHAAWRRSR